MYKAHKCSNDTTECNHVNIFTDDIEGIEVCVDCCKVITEVLYGEELNIQEERKGKEEEEEVINKKIQQEIETVKTLQDMWHFPTNVITETNTLFHKIMNMKLNLYTRDIYIFSFYQSLILNKCACLPDEIASVFDLNSVKKLSEISKLTHINALPDLIDFIHRLSTNLNFTFKEKTQISNLCEHLSFLPSIQPQTLSALIIYYFCLNNKQDVHIKEIAQKCFISMSTLKRNIKKYDDIRHEINKLLH